MIKNTVSRGDSYARIVMCMLVSVIIITGLFSGDAYGATVSKNTTKTHPITVDDKPLLVTIAVQAKDSYDGTYTTSGTTRTFSNHKETVTLTSINDKTYTSKIRGLLPQLQFHTPSNKVSCPEVTCHCAFYIGSPIFRVEHQCSNKKTTCQKGSTAYMVGGYTLTGGMLPVNVTTKFTGIAN